MSCWHCGDIAATPTPPKTVPLCARCVRNGWHEEDGKITDAREPEPVSEFDEVRR